MNKQYKEILSGYFPPETIDQVSVMLEKYAVHLTISRNRSSKLGDYRTSSGPGPHRISVNGGMSPVLTYLVFLHEYAHLMVRNKYGRRLAPHGKQWKDEFGSLLNQAIFLGFIPDHLTAMLRQFAKNAKATFASDRKLWRALQVLEHNSDAITTLDELPLNSYFSVGNGRVFRKEEKLRTRYRCFCLTNNLRYLFHPLAVINPLGEDLPVKTIKL